MKLAVISDLHMDVSRGYPVLEAVAQAARNKAADILVIGGDISNEPDRSMSAVEWLQAELGHPVYFVPGNHDIYDTEGLYSSTRHVYEALRRHPQCLSGRDATLGQDWVLLGDLFWYDYSFADTEKYTRNQFRIQFHEGRMWNDHRFIKWGEDDQTVSDRFISNMRQRLEKHSHKKKIVVSHMVMNNDFVNWGQFDNVDFFSAFLGSVNIGALMEEFKVNHNYMGHVHLRREKSTACCHYACPCLGGYREWESDDVFREAENVMHMQELE